MNGSTPLFLAQEFTHALTDQHIPGTATGPSAALHPNQQFCMMSHVGAGYAALLLHPPPIGAPALVGLGWQ
jgi:hypothetical protein